MASESSKTINHLKELQRINCEVFGMVGLFYMYLARPIFNEFGKKGEIAIRKGLRNYGSFRGEGMRKWHVQEHIPINMESLQRFWDNGYSYMYLNDKISKGALFSPFEVRQSELKCPAQDFWEEENWTQFGYIYCDEIHQEIAKAYHPKAIVEIHENLNKGDPQCSFVFMMPPEGHTDESAYDNIIKKIKNDPTSFHMNVLKKTVRMVGSIYYYLSKSIIDNLGDKGRKVLVTSMQDLGKRRGEIIKDKLLKSGEEINLINIFNFFDLPYNIVWQASAKKNITVHYCPLAEVWKELGDKELGALYCNIMYKSMFEVLSTKVKISECIACGSNKCVIDLYI